MGVQLSQSINHALNVIRTTAAILVALGHMRTLLFVDYGASESRSVWVQALYLLGSLGHPAVIVFFVLSGYLVGGGTIRAVASGQFTWLSYGVARMARLWIVLLPALFLTQIFDRAGAWINRDSEIYKGSSAYHAVIPPEGVGPFLGWAEVLGNAFFVQSIHVHTLGTNSPLWSLAYEFWYYLLFPAALMALSGKFGVRTRVLSAGIFILGSFVAGLEVLLLFPVWILGALVSWQSGRIARLLLRISALGRRCLRLLCAVSVLAAAVASDFMGGGYVVVAAFVTIPTAALIASTTVDNSPLPKRMSVWGGLSGAAAWSYTLYAIHMPVLAFLVSFAVPRADDRLQLTPWTSLAGLAALVAVCAAAYGWSQLTEAKSDRVRSAVLWLLTKRSFTPPSSVHKAQ